MLSHSHNVSVSYGPEGDRGGNPVLHAHLKASAARTGTCRHHESRLNTSVASLSWTCSSASWAKNCRNRHSGMTMMLVKLRTAMKMSRPISPFDGRRNVMMMVWMSMAAACMDAATMSRQPLCSPAVDPDEYDNNLCNFSVRGRVSG